jgi:hypothetical protein
MWLTFIVKPVHRGQLQQMVPVVPASQEVSWPQRLNATAGSIAELAQAMMNTTREIQNHCVMLGRTHQVPSAQATIAEFGFRGCHPHRRA